MKFAFDFSCARILVSFYVAKTFRSSSAFNLCLTDFPFQLWFYRQQIPLNYFYLLTEQQMSLIVYLSQTSLNLRTVMTAMMFLWPKAFVVSFLALFVSTLPFLGHSSVVSLVWRLPSQKFWIPIISSLLCLSVFFIVLSFFSFDVSKIRSFWLKYATVVGFTLLPYSSSYCLSHSVNGLLFGHYVSWSQVFQ